MQVPTSLIWLCIGSSKSFEALGGQRILSMGFTVLVEIQTWQYHGF